MDVPSSRGLARANQWLGRAGVVGLALTVSLAAGLHAQRIFRPDGPQPVIPASAPQILPPPATTSHLPAHEAIVPTPVAPPQPDPLIAAHDLDVGTFYYHRGNYVGALSRFEDAIFNDPTSAQAYCSAGDAEWKLKHALPARADWQRCLHIAESGKWAQHARQALAKHPLPAGPAARP